MKIVVVELLQSLFKEITITERNRDLRAVRPHLLVFNREGCIGSLRVKILDMNEKIIAQSDAIPISTLGESPYIHGYFDFPVKAGLRVGESYLIAVVAEGGYSFSEEAWIGWVNEAGFRDTATYLVNKWNAPFDAELWESKQVRRGAA